MTINWHIEDNRLTILRAVKGEDGEDFDISIGLSVDGKSVTATPPLGDATAAEIQTIVRGCLESFQSQLQRDNRPVKNLEQIGFSVELGEGNSKTAALVTKAGSSVLESLNDLESIKDSIQTSDLALSPEIVQKLYADRDSSSVNEELINLGRIFTNSYVLATKPKSSPANGVSEPTPVPQHARVDVGTKPSSAERTPVVVPAAPAKPVSQISRSPILSLGNPETNEKREKLLRGAIQAFTEKETDSCWKKLSLEKLQAGKRSPRDLPIQEAFEKKRRAGEETPELDRLYEQFYAVAPEFFKEYLDKQIGSEAGADARVELAKHLLQITFIDKIAAIWLPSVSH